MLPAFITTVLFAISAVTANRAAKILGGIQANFWRITLATLMLAAWAHSFGSGLSGDGFLIFLLSGAVGFGIGDVALYQALPRIGSRLSIMLVHCLAAPFAAVSEWLWMGTTLTSMQILSSVTILAGVSLALAPGKHLDLTMRTLVIGILFGILAAFGQGFGAVLSRKAYEVTAAAGQSIDGMTAAYQRILAGWIVAALFMLGQKQRTRWIVTSWMAEPAAATPVPKTQWNQVRHLIVINALAGPTLGVSCYQWALATTPTGIVLPIVATTPLAVIPFARVMEGEHPSVRSLAGGVIAVIGAIALTVVR